MRMMKPLMICISSMKITQQILAEKLGPEKDKKNNNLIALYLPVDLSSNLAKKATLSFLFLFFLFSDSFVCQINSSLCKYL